MDQFYDTNTDRAAQLEYRRKESFKWFFVFLAFAGLSLISALVKDAIVKGTDLLSGKAAVERFFIGNLVKCIILFVLLIAFIIFFIKTWKGRESSAEQLLFSVVTAILLIFFAVKALMPVLKIADELKHPQTVELSSYTLCRSDKYCYVAFNDDGAVLLAIPDEKYAQLQNGNASGKKSAGQAHQLVVDDDYKDIQYYESDLSISYYNKSIIYIDAKLEQGNN